MDGKRIKELLLAYNTSQSEVAKQLGMSQQSFSQMLSSSDIKTSLVERIAGVLKIPVSTIYGETTINNNPVYKNNGYVSANNNVTSNAGDTAVLTERVKMLERLLEEKERTIKILMEK